MAGPGFLHKKNRKKYTPGRSSGAPRKYPENTEKIPKTGIFGISGVFCRYFRGILGVFSGTPEFRAGGVFFSVFFVEIPGRAISTGSVAGRGVN